MAKIIVESDEIEIDEKRFYLPGVKLTHECSKCGHLIELDFSTDYLMEPTANVPFQQYLYCDECDEEQYVSLRLNISLEVVE